MYKIKLDFIIIKLRLFIDNMHNIKIKQLSKINKRTKCELLCTVHWFYFYIPKLFEKIYSDNVHFKINFTIRHLTNYHAYY